MAMNSTPPLQVHVSGCYSLSQKLYKHPELAKNFSLTHGARVISVTASVPIPNMQAEHLQL